MHQLIEKIHQTRDWQAIVLLLLLGSAATWILILPFSGSFQTAAMKRFHLTTACYWQWAVQQTIPSMYNFENRYWISETQLEPEQLGKDVASARKLGLNSRFANHFPARVFTFADTRHHYLGPEKREGVPARYLYLQSRYRGTTVRTRLEAIPDKRGGYWINRREDFYE